MRLSQSKILFDSLQDSIRIL